LKLAAMGGWPRADQGGLAMIEEWCKLAPNPVLVVVDTLARFRKPPTAKQPLYAADYEALTGLQKIATEYKIAIVVLHHDRKADADDAFDTVSGTLGLTAAADTILIIKRRSSGVTLYARGRDIEDSETAIQFDKETCRWVILGKAAEVQRSSERARVIAVLEAAGQPLSPKEIMMEAGMPNRNAIDLLLFKMARDGEVERVMRGRYNLPSKSNGQIGQEELAL
jgi:RecA-family ATPase